MVQLSILIVVVVTQSYTHTNEIWISSMNFINISCLVLILNHSFIRCQCWGRLDEGYSGLPFTFLCTSSESILISKQKVFLKIGYIVPTR